MPERQQRGWIYILHVSQDKLALQLQQRLNASSQPVWIRDRDSKGMDEREAHIDAVRKASMMIVLETSALYRNRLSKEILLEGQRRSKGFRKIVVEVDPTSKARERRNFSVNAVVQMTDSFERDFKKILGRLERQRSIVAMGSSRPSRSKARYVFLSHVGKQSSLVDEIDRELAAMGANVWTYLRSARDASLHFHNEIRKKVENAAAVIIVLNAAWKDSEECQREHKFALGASRRLIWLWCGRGKPPAPDGDDAMIDLRPHARDEGFALLEKHLFPKRKQSRRTG